jgi:hypothetical protein
LFYLIRDGKDKILLNPAFLDDPEECWMKLKDLEANGELQKRMGDAFSDWFMHSPREVCENNPKLVKLCRGVVLLWKGSADDQDQWMQRQWELKKMKHHLDYLKNVATGKGTNSKPTKLWRKSARHTFLRRSMNSWTRRT